MAIPINAELIFHVNSHAHEYPACGSARPRRLDLPGGALDVDEALRSRRRFYWGTIRHVGRGNGACFLNTIGNLPTVVVRDDAMARLRERMRFDDVDEFIGGSFIIRGTLGLSSDRFWLHVAENGLEWFAGTLPPAEGRGVPSEARLHRSSGA